MIECQLARTERRGCPNFQDFQLPPESSQPPLAVNEAKRVEELIENTIPERLTSSKARWLSYIAVIHLKIPGGGIVGLLEPLNSPGRHPGIQRVTAAAAIPSTCSFYCQCAAAQESRPAPVCIAETVR